MPDFVPATIVRVLKDVPLDSTYSDTIKFASQAAQTAFFTGKAKYSFTDFTYQRVNSSVAQPRGPRSVRVPRVADDLYDCNYLMFQNRNYGTKWFYAFIKQVNYINPNNTEIIYELDHYQTWAFDFNVLASFVEREHTNNDAYYANLEPEPVDIGEHKYWDTSIFDIPEFSFIIVATSTDPGGKTVLGQTISNIYSGLQFEAFTTAAEANFYIQQYAANGYLENVVSVFMSPFSPEDTTPLEVNFSLTPKILGYTPRNKKLFSFPYCSYMVVDGNNNYQEFRYEYSNSDEQGEAGDIHVTGKTYRIFSASPIMVFVPDYIDDSNYYYALETSYSAVCPWTGNVYANWFAQNGMQLALKTLASVGINTASGNIIGAGSAIINAASSAYSSQFIPTPSHNTLDANACYSLGRLKFYWYQKSITSEIASKIDDFFDVFGYATNEYKVPNMEGRESWNYVKTRDVIISGSVPVDSMDAIKSMFNNGIRFWHGDFVGDYSRSNRPLSEVQNNA